MEKFKAFTLAEVLVTLGIIGVVSAMTVPTLMQNYQRQSYVTQLHKIYNEFGQAAERYKADNNLVSIREGRIIGNADELNAFLKRYFKVVKANEDVNHDGVVDENDVISDTGANAGMAISIEVDINGTKGPNIAGRDLFSFDIAPDGLVLDSKRTDSSTVDTAHAWPVGIGKIIADGWQMTY